ncbi:MAG: translocation/assembly module TamB domain-containing protein, partial [Bacteroidaceae bacterium]|nr:translocation/assembly module TamB domain-containing protein [Bacteroidaceae bacterium]
GDVRHDYLRRMKYEFRIHTDNLLCYETHDFGDGMPFYATAYTGGDISIIGGGGRLDINADVTANAGSTLVYNATTPEEVSNTHFITFVDKTPRELDVLNVLPTAENDKKRKDKEEESTDIYIDFNVNMTPEATIRVLMDRASGDYISANGTGNLKASYYNKGSFKMFGLYDITKGMYRMSMQEVIRKEFNFRDGGTVTFNGDPFLAQLDVKANYTVNSASLRDLSPTATFTQKSSTRVNCIMNIEGSLKKPSITFDLELPTVSEEDKSMVKSLVATEEQMNMQIIYLLGVGRFYGGDYTQDTADQTNLAMNSFLASTLSGQFNQMLSQVINSSNWNLGASINPGQSGTNNMEFQTMLQGSLFNNRLLINGNFGYKENVMMNNNFVGDFDIQWFINNARTISLKAYNETNERYFTRNTLNTQGLGIQFRYEFERWNDLFRFTRKKNKSAR